MLFDSLWKPNGSFRGTYFRAVKAFFSFSFLFFFFAPFCLETRMKAKPVFVLVSCVVGLLTHHRYVCLLLLYARQISFSPLNIFSGYSRLAFWIARARSRPVSLVFIKKNALHCVQPIQTENSHFDNVLSYLARSAWLPFYYYYYYYYFFEILFEVFGFPAALLSG